MLNKLKLLFLFSTSFLTTLVFADPDENYLGISNSKLREWDISMSDIPKAIQSVTTFILSFSATIAMIMIIVWALKWSLWSIDSSPDKKKAQDTIKYWIYWFVVSVSAWFIVNVVIQNI